MRPAQDFHLAIEMLDNRRTALNPVAGVDVFDVAGLLDNRMMDVAANHPFNPAALCFIGKHLLERTDKIHGLLDPKLGPG
jgi:hypothetical protein